MSTLLGDTFQKSFGLFI